MLQVISHTEASSHIEDARQPRIPVSSNGTSTPVKARLSARKEHLDHQSSWDCGGRLDQTSEAQTLETGAHTLWKISGNL